MAKEKSTSTSISVTDFKAKCLGLFDEADRKGREFTVTKKGRPIAKIVPLKKNSESLRGSLKGLADIKGDIVTVDTSADWEALKK